MAPKKKNEAQELMIVNDVPGEECRVAVITDGHLEELYTERTSTATNVGNIYKGRVVNVEAAIQAAFVDFGEGQNGFLHISDLHPKYFPEGDRVERVGKKIPRRERPPIQEALRRGDEVLVQVLKEGIGTKGPTLTSYLSIPGRLLVMMPDMDRVGISRKEEDQQRRREMRELLDSLDLPEGFGFIVRTAGVGSPKIELKRDAAYLTRLWKVMEKRLKKVGAPCELYRESDVLIRTVRDVMRPTIKAIIVDSESAYRRVDTFLSVVSPRSAPKVVQYRRRTPIFHAYDIERQIELIHSREVPLPSGGRLIIDQTEALVAIDVNSGRSRSATDSETNAFETNLEAADEICRQLRLRDLGGLVVNDLIDMHARRHRQQIEDRFDMNLKRDRARTTMARISEFGLLEMTRQRMRPSLRKAHFVPCPHCAGHGEIRASDYVASDATRRVAFLLEVPRAARVEIVCSPRVASVLLSTKRRELVRLEDLTGKRIDVRVSDAIATDRIDYYAYDDRNADIDITQLPRQKAPSVDDLLADTAEEPAEEAGVSVERTESGRRSRRRRPEPADATAMAMAGGFDDLINEEEMEEAVDRGEEDGSSEAARDRGEEESSEQREGVEGRRRRRRGRGRGRGRRQEGVGGEEAVNLETSREQALDAPREYEATEAREERAEAASERREAYNEVSREEEGYVERGSEDAFSQAAPEAAEEMWDSPESGREADEPTVFVPSEVTPAAVEAEIGGEGRTADREKSMERWEEEGEGGRRRRRRRGRGRGRRGEGETTAAIRDGGERVREEEPARRDPEQRGEREREGSGRRRRRRGGRGRDRQFGRDGGRSVGEHNGERRDRGEMEGRESIHRQRAESNGGGGARGPEGASGMAAGGGKPRRTLYGRYGRASSLAKAAPKPNDE